MSKGRSAKGEIVDFDLLKIKEQIASAPPSHEVKRRMEFIENRLRRRTKKAPVVVPQVDVDNNNVTTAEPVEVKEDIVVEQAPIEQKTTTTTKKTTKQKARTTKTTE